MKPPLPLISFSRRIGSAVEEGDRGRSSQRAHHDVGAFGFPSQHRPRAVRRPGSRARSVALRLSPIDRSTPVINTSAEGAFFRRPAQERARCPAQHERGGAACR